MLPPWGRWTGPCARALRAGDWSGVKIWDAQGRIVYSDAASAGRAALPLGEDDARRSPAPADPGRHLEPGRAGEPAGARPGQAAAGLPAGLDAVGQAAAVRDLRAVRHGDRAHAPAVAGVRRGHADQPAPARACCCCRSCGGCSTGSRAPRRSARRCCSGRWTPRPRSGGGSPAALHDGVVQDLAATSFAVAGAAERAAPAGPAAAGRQLRAAAGTVRGEHRRPAVAAGRHLPAEPGHGRAPAALTDLAADAAARACGVSLDRRRRDRADAGPASGGVPGGAGVPAQHRQRHAAAAASVRAAPDAAERRAGGRRRRRGLRRRGGPRAPAEGHFGLRVLAGRRRRGRRPARRVAPRRGAGTALAAAGAASMTSVLLVDDHRLVRAGLIELLSTTDDLQRRRRGRRRWAGRRRWPTAATGRGADGPVDAGHGRRRGHPAILPADPQIQRRRADVLRGAGTGRRRAGGRCHRLPAQGLRPARRARGGPAGRRWARADRPAGGRALLPSGRPRGSETAERAGARGAAARQHRGWPTSRSAARSASPNGPSRCTSATCSAGSASPTASSAALWARDNLPAARQG